MAITPTFTEVIKARGENTTRRKLRLEAEETARLKSESDKRALRAANRAANEERSKKATTVAETKCEAVRALLRKSGITDFIADGVAAFGDIRDDVGLDHDQRGYPKKVGAYKDEWSYWANRWETDLDKPEDVTVKYVIEGTSLNYLRAEGLTGRALVLSRYAVFLAEGEATDNQPVIWHGELPQLKCKKGVSKSGAFNKILKAATTTQIEDLVYERKHHAIKGFVPRLVREAVPFDAENIEPALLDIDAGLTEFAERRFVPLA